MKKLLLLLLIPFLSFGQDAILIGVSNYKNSPLDNPINDVKLLEKVFHNKGWNVTKLLNPSTYQLKSTLGSFLSNRGNTNKPVLIYFSGHGFQVSGENYLMPLINSPSHSLSATMENSLSITELSYFSRKISAPKIFIIDACRSYPSSNNIMSPSLGLNSQYASSNTLIAYATSPGAYAFDGLYNNSPYAESLASAISKSETINEAFNKTRILTIQKTNKEQIPWESSSLYENVYLNYYNNVPINNPLQNQESFDSKEEAAFVGHQKRDEVKTFEDAVNYIIHLVENADIEAFYEWNKDTKSRQFINSKTPEIDRQGVIVKLKNQIQRVNSGHTRMTRGAFHIIVRFFQTGVINPACREGNGFKLTCGDSDRMMILQPDLGLGLKMAQLAKYQNVSSNLLAHHYKNGWIVKKDLLKAYDLYMNDRSLGGEYYGVDINEMVQTELNNLGENIAVDGDFGPGSCRALKNYIGETNCKWTVTREQITRLVSVIGFRD